MGRVTYLVCISHIPLMHRYLLEEDRMLYFRLCHTAFCYYLAHPNNFSKAYVFGTAVQSCRYIKN